MLLDNLCHLVGTVAVGFSSYIGGGLIRLLLVGAVAVF